ncbi:hypothetical protein ACPEEZ_14480 [Frigoribacterium sp. 2-23]|uniref:hypothetical protein n=1 Tax=Frigoribacterium sp. 2-23 TaxID=3415006 RepID=UPI003C6EE90D
MTASVAVVTGVAGCASGPGPAPTPTAGEGAALVPQVLATLDADSPSALTDLFASAPQDQVSNAFDGCEPVSDSGRRVDVDERSATLVTVHLEGTQRSDPTLGAACDFQLVWESRYGWKLSGQSVTPTR